MNSLRNKVQLIGNLGKAPEIKISQHTFDQIARYNLALKAEYLMVTNGLEHYFCQMDYENERYHFLQELPQPNI